MDWKRFLTTLGYRVAAGCVTTYAQVSLWGYGVHNYDQPVRSLLRGVANHGQQRLTNCVVGTDGRLADLPEGSDQQKRQLLDEGDPFTPDGRLDFGGITPVTLA